MCDSPKPVDLREVLLCFVNAEIGTDHCKRIQALWEGGGHAWDIIANLADPDKLYLLRVSFDAPEKLNDSELVLCARWLGEFGLERKTLIPFTTGTYADTRNLRVDKWRLMKVPVSELWVYETDSETTEILSEHAHNIVDAIEKLKEANNHKEWDETLNPPPIICLQCDEPTYKGKYWVLDGSHRAIGKALVDPTSQIDAYIGEWQGPPGPLSGSVS